MGRNVAIDGPAGAGKSTIAKRLAEKLGYIYVDTGAMYRAMALYVMTHGIDAANEEKVAEACGDIRVELAYDGKEQQILLNGENVTGRIRTEEVGNTASAISVYGCVRTKLVALQKELAAKTDVIMDGRDIGTCVLPDAQVKVYLTASVETRAQRRFKELQEKNVDCDLEEIRRDIAERDERDMNRKISPLRQAKDAHLLDSSDMTIDEVVAAIMALCESAEQTKEKNG